MIIRYVVCYAIVVIFGWIMYGAGKHFGKREVISQMRYLYILKGPEIIMAMLDPDVTNEQFINQFGETQEE